MSISSNQTRMGRPRRRRVMFANARIQHATTLQGLPLFPALRTYSAASGGRVKSRRPMGAHDVVHYRSVAEGEAVGELLHGRPQAAGRQAGPIGSNDL